MARRAIPQAPPPVTSPFLNKDGTVSAPWARYFFNSYEREGGAQDGIYENILIAGFGDATVADLAAQSDLLGESIARLQANNSDALAAEINSRIDGLQADVNRALAASSGQEFLSDIEAVINARLEQVKASVLAAISEDIQQAISDLNDQVIVANNGVAQLRGEDTAAYLSNLTTDQVPEGTLNLYFTETRARASISVSGSLAYNPTTGVLSYTTPNSDGIVEGSTNLYFTVARARGSVGASGDLSYNPATGVFSYSTPSNSATASKWATARTLSFTGDITGSNTVDGSANVAFALAIAAGHVTPAMLSTGGPSWDGSGNLTVTTVKVGSNQVVGARDTGWTACSGTAQKAGYATYTAPTIAIVFDPTQLQSIANSLQDVSRTVKAMTDQGLTQGNIGT